MILSILLLSVVASFLAASINAHGREIRVPVQKWPDNWPKELDMYRDHAMGYGFGMAFVIENIYIMQFENREEFEAIWPVLLKLKGKTGTITLRTFAPEQHPWPEPEFALNKPRLQIHCPGPSLRPLEDGKYERTSDGNYEYVGPWEDEVDQSEHPESWAVAKRKSDGKWVLYEDTAIPDLANKYDGLPLRTRVDLILSVDGSVIDLTRIKFPEGTVVKDHRRKDDVEAVPVQFGIVKPTKPNETEGEMSNAVAAAAFVVMLISALVWLGRRKPTQPTAGAN